MSPRQHRPSVSNTSADAVPLSQVVRQAREKLGITPQVLARKCALPVAMIEDIEAGLERILSPMHRQKLATALRIKPTTLRNAEYQVPRNVTPEDSEAPLAADSEPVIFTDKDRQTYIERIIHFPNETLPCPECNSPLFARIFERRDLEDNPLLEVKAHCTRCLFKL